MNETKKEFIESTLTLKEACQFFGFRSVERLRQKVKFGIIPAFKTGKGWMIYRKDAVEYAEKLKNINTTMEQ